jgi:RNA recognition motif-containing protein
MLISVIQKIKQLFVPRQAKKNKSTAPLAVGTPNRELYVGNIDYRISNQELKDIFKLFNTIEAVKIIRDPKGRSKGYGFVRFAVLEDAVNALNQMNGQPIHGRPLCIAYAKKSDH